MGANGPPQLGADDVVRYASAEHFLDDYRENLALGRMFVRTRRNFPVQSTLRVAIEGPGVSWSVGADVLVLLSRAGFLGLEFLQFDDQVKPTLDLLVEEVQAEQNARKGPAVPAARRAMVPREEVTVIGSLPNFFPSAPPADPTEGTRVQTYSLGTTTLSDPDTQGAGSARVGTDPPRGGPAPVPTLPPEAAARGLPEEDDGESLGVLRRPGMAMPKTRAEVEAERAAALRAREVELPKTRAEVEAERAAALRAREVELPKTRAEVEAERRARARGEPEAERSGSTRLRDADAPRARGEGTGERARRADAEAERSGSFRTKEAEAARARAEREAADRARAEREAADRARAEREAADRARAEREAAERARAEREAADRARAEREAAERARAEREAAERARAEREAAERARAEREAADRARAEREAADRARAEREAAERARAEREATERARAEREAAERARAEREAAETAARVARARNDSDLALPRSRADLEAERAALLRTRADVESPRGGAELRTAVARYDSDLEEVSGVVPLDDDDSEDSYESPPPRAPLEATPARDVAPSAPPGSLTSEPPRNSQPAATSLVDDLTPAPPPALPSLDVFDALPGLRATPGGVVRIPDPAELLGVYLTHIRHGVLPLCGGPSGDVGDAVTVKLVGRRVLSLEARVTARVGAWVFVSLEQADEVRDLLRDAADDWRAGLERAGLGSAPLAATSAPLVAAPAAEVIAPAPRASTPAPPSRAPARAPEPPPRAPEPPPRAPEPVVPEVSAAAPETSAAEPAPMVFDESGPPQPGRLDGDAIVFRGPKDLEHEVTTNLKNGGLIAHSPPLPIRTHKSLRVVVGSVELGVRIEADVVYAASGRVGFAVTSFADAAGVLERAIKAGIGAPSAPSVAPPSIAPSIPPASTGAASVPPSSGDPAQEVLGRIAKSLSPGELLDLPNHRAESDADLEEAPSLVVFDYVIRKKLRGVLHLKRTATDQVSVYVHEGSVAFVDARPFNEDHALGKLFAAQKKLTEPQIRDVVERSRRERRPFGKTLLALGLVNANALVLTLRDQARLKLDPVLEWSGGTFELAPWSEPPTRADLVLTSGQSVAVRHVRHLFERMTSNEIEDLLAPNLSRVVGLSQEVDPTSPVFGFQPKELRFLQAWVDAKRNLSEVVTGSPVGRLASLRLVGFGLAMNLLRFTDGKRAAGGRAAAPRRSTDGRGYGAMKRSLEEDLKILRTQNFFDVLGVHWSAHHRSYPVAYQKARARFDPTRGELRDAPPPVLALAKEATAIVEAAYKKLTIEEERIKYRKQLFDQTEREYSADMLIKQAEVLSMRGDRIGAIEAFETAVELAPTTRNRTLLAAAREGRSL